MDSKDSAPNHKANNSLSAPQEVCNAKTTNKKDSHIHRYKTQHKIRIAQQPHSYTIQVTMLYENLIPGTHQPSNFPPPPRLSTNSPIASKAKRFSTYHKIASHPVLVPSRAPLSISSIVYSKSLNSSPSRPNLLIYSPPKPPFKETHNVDKIKAPKQFWTSHTKLHPSSIIAAMPWACKVITAKPGHWLSSSIQRVWSAIGGKSLHSESIYNRTKGQDGY